MGMLISQPQEGREWKITAALTKDSKNQTYPGANSHREWLPSHPLDLLEPTLGRGENLYTAP